MGNETSVLTSNIATQADFLENLLDRAELWDQFFYDPNQFAQSQGVKLDREIIDLLLDHDFTKEKPSAMRIPAVVGSTSTLAQTLLVASAVLSAAASSVSAAAAVSALSLEPRLQ